MPRAVWEQWGQMVWTVSGKTVKWWRRRESNPFAVKIVTY
jgi:hypothetical protein